MSNKRKYIIFFGAIFGLLGFAHSIRCSDTPIISSLVGWLTICTAVYHFGIEAWIWPEWPERERVKEYFTENPAFPMLVGALAFSALQHAFIYIDAYWIESIVAALFFLVFYYFLGKAVDG